MVHARAWLALFAVLAGCSDPPRVDEVEPTPPEPVILRKDMAIAGDTRVGGLNGCIASVCISMAWPQPMYEGHLGNRSVEGLLINVSYDGIATSLEAVKVSVKCHGTGMREILASVTEVPPFTISASGLAACLGARLEVDAHRSDAGLEPSGDVLTMEGTLNLFWPEDADAAGARGLA